MDGTACFGNVTKSCLDDINIHITDQHHHHHKNKTVEIGDTYAYTIYTRYLSS